MIKPQKGAQTKFLSCPADIAIFGGAAGSSKSFSLLLEPLRHSNNPNFSGVIFRRESPQITNPGGLLDESKKIYPLLGAQLNISRLEWTFPSGMKIKFSHMQLETDMFAWQGAQVPFIGWDELTHFTETQFFYMLSRLRSMSGVPGYIRSTCNPDPDSFVAKLISWWLDEQGFPIPERGGVLRWFVRLNDELIWADTKEELLDKYGKDQIPKSFTFIPATIYDNPILLKKDLNYLSNLMALPMVDRARLLGGNWRIRPAAGLYFKRHWFKVIEKDQLPARRKRVRYWDRAASEKTENNNPDWTAGVLMSRDERGMLYVEHVERFRGTPMSVEDAIKNTAALDGRDTTIVIEQDPGQAGKFESSYYVRALSGFTVKTNPVRENKITRASPFSSQCEHKNVCIVKGTWNDVYLSELESFPDSKVNDDQVDASSGAFKMLTTGLSSTFVDEMVETGMISSREGW